MYDTCSFVITSSLNAMLYAVSQNLHIGAQSLVFLLHNSFMSLCLKFLTSSQEFITSLIHLFLFWAISWGVISKTNTFGEFSTFLTSVKVWLSSETFWNPIIPSSIREIVIRKKTDNARANSTIVLPLIFFSIVKILSS